MSRRILVAAIVAWTMSGMLFAAPPAHKKPITPAELHFAYANAPEIVTNEIEFDGRHPTLRLKRFDIFAPDARLLLADGVNEAPLPKPDVALFHGTIDGEPDSRVFLGLTPDQAVVIADRSGVRTTSVIGGQNSPTPIDLLQSTSHELTPPTLSCDADTLSGLLPISSPNEDAATSSSVTRGDSSDCHVIQLAVECDYEFGQHFGDSDAALAYAALLFGATTEIYDRDLNSQVELIFVRLWDTPDDPWNETAPGRQRVQLRNYWEANMTDVHRHGVHLLSTRTLGGGSAYIAGLCRVGGGYAVSGNLRGSFPYPTQDHHPLNWDIYVVAHETGHLLGAVHTHQMIPPVDGCGNGDCSVIPNGTLMSYCHQCSGGLRNVTLMFHPRNIDEQITPFINDPNTVMDCPDLTLATPSILKSPTSTSVCVGGDVTLRVAASGSFLEYQWRKDEVDIPGAIGDQLVLNNVSAASVGAYDVVVKNRCSEALSAGAFLSVCENGLPGDVNFDCRVDIADLAVSLSRFGVTNGATAADGDTDADGDVDLDDLQTSLANYAQPCGG